MFLLLYNYLEWNTIEFLCILMIKCVDLSDLNTNKEEDFRDKTEWNVKLILG